MPLEWTKKEVKVKSQRRIEKKKKEMRLKKQECHVLRRWWHWKRQLLEADMKNEEKIKGGRKLTGCGMDGT